jgi:uncharacterized Ntn-hydrolase superfamily protein
MVRVSDFSPGRLAATYSITARDPATGELGIAVQSSYFSVGTDVSWAAAGVGAIATQSIVEASYGPRGLELLRAGQSAKQALDELVEQDPGRELRQVAFVDAKGRTAAFTGAACVPARGQAFGDECSVQGNMLQSDAVWQAMIPAFESATGSLADRLMAALLGAEAAGGDVRGRQSAALLVVPADPKVPVWKGRIVDLHVEDHPHPLDELGRLLQIRRAYDLFEEARSLFFADETDAAIAKTLEARRLQPENVQFAFWTGIALANAGRNDEARPWLAEAFADHPGWRELGLRLAEHGLYHGDRRLLEP